jgi:hypothetical protein
MLSSSGANRTFPSRRRPEEDLDGQGNRAERLDGPRGRRRRRQGESGELADRGPVLDLGLLAEKERDENVPRGFHRFGQDPVVLDPVARALAQDEVEEDRFRPAGLEIIDDGHVDLARPRPGKALRLFIDVEALLVDEDEGDVRIRPGGRSEQPQPEVPGLPLQGLENAQGMDEERDQEYGPPDGEAADSFGHRPGPVRASALSRPGGTAPSDVLDLGATSFP